MVYAIVTLDVLQDRIQSVSFRKQNQGNTIGNNIMTVSLPIDESEVERTKMIYPVGANWKNVTNRKRIKGIDLQLSKPETPEISNDAINIVRNLSH